MPRSCTHALLATRPTSHHNCRRLRWVNDQLRRRHLAGGSSGEVTVFDLDSPALMVWEAILLLLNLTSLLQLWVMLAQMSMLLLGRGVHIRRQVVRLLAERAAAAQAQGLRVTLVLRCHAHLRWVVLLAILRLLHRMLHLHYLSLWNSRIVGWILMWLLTNWMQIK